MACFYLFHCVRYRPDPFGKKFGADVVQKEGKDKDQKQDAQYIFLQNLTSSLTMDMGNALTIYQGPEEERTTL